jgi:hypothetical protein
VTDAFLLDVLKALIPIAVLETGVLVFYCGVVGVSILDLRRRVGAVEQWKEKCIYQLAPKRAGRESHECL